MVSFRPSRPNRGNNLPGLVSDEFDVVRCRTSLNIDDVARAVVIDIASVKLGSRGSMEEKGGSGGGRVTLSG
jgi:hypothetical protein